jgi:Holliday junction resolvase RusA-like endonuclease
VTLSFTYHGSLTSNNAVARAVKGKVLKSASAREDTKRVRELCQVAADIAHWSMPEAASLEITAWNTRKDCGNVEKVLSDGCNGIAWKDDRCVVKLTVEKRKDRGGERYDVTVSAAQPLTTPKKAAPRVHVFTEADLAPGFPFRAPRTLKQLRSGQVLTFEERDRLLAELEK